jgi:hypothetical protein
MNPTILDRLETSETRDWCLSGGAAGSDLLWGQAAKANGHGVIHFSFPGAITKADPNDLWELDDDALALADPHCLAANQILKRRFPPRSQRVKRLLQRDWHQVNWAESVYAISFFDETTGMIDGGTAWAVEMFLNLHNRETCPAYVFDQNRCRWYHWTGTWAPIYEPPKPQGVWAGIGKRAINVLGRLAICVLMDYHPRERTIWD